VTASILDDCEEQAGGGGGRARSSLEQYHKSECNLRLGGLNKKIIIFTNIGKQSGQMPVALEKELNHFFLL